MKQFVLVVRDGADGKTVEVAGLSEPEAFDPSSPSHKLGRWLQNNWDEVVHRAAFDAKKTESKLLVDQAKTIVVPQAGDPSIDWTLQTR